MATLARNLSAFESRRDFRQSQETRAKFWHVAIVSSIFRGRRRIGPVSRGGHGYGRRSEATVQVSRRRAAVPAGSPAHCKTENSAITSSLITGQRLPSKTGLAGATKTSPSQKKKNRQRSAGANSVGSPFTDLVGNCGVPTDNRPAPCRHNRHRETAYGSWRQRLYRPRAYRGCACA